MSTESVLQQLLHDARAMKWYPEVAQEFATPDMDQIGADLAAIGRKWRGKPICDETVEGMRRDLRALVTRHDNRLVCVMVPRGHDLVGFNVWVGMIGPETPRWVLAELKKKGVLP